MDVTNASQPTAGLNLHTLRRLKFWVWFQEWTRPTELQVTLIWAGIIGFCGAVCSIAYRIATDFVHKILTGSSAPGLVESFTQLSLLWRLVIPAIGGLIAGAVIHFGSRFHGQLTTTDYMEAVVLGDGREKFIATRFNYLYVTDNGRFLGAVSLHDIKSYLNTPELAKVVIAGDLLHDSFPLVRANASLIEALERFSHHDGERLPVVSHDRHLVGSISKTDVILALAGSTARSATVTGSPGSV